MHHVPATRAKQRSEVRLDYQVALIVQRAGFIRIAVSSPLQTYRRVLPPEALGRVSVSREAQRPDDLPASPELEGSPAVFLLQLEPKPERRPKKLAWLCSPRHPGRTGAGRSKNYALGGAYVSEILRRRLSTFLIKSANIPENLVCCIWTSSICKVRGCHGRQTSDKLPV